MKPVLKIISIAVALIPIKANAEFIPYRNSNSCNYLDSGIDVQIEMNGHLRSVSPQSEPKDKELKPVKSYIVFSCINPSFSCTYTELEKQTEDTHFRMYGRSAKLLSKSSNVYTYQIGTGSELVFNTITNKVTFTEEYKIGNTKTTKVLEGTCRK